MVWFLCGLDNVGSAQIGTGSETYENQRLKQVMVASSTTPFKLEIHDRLYSEQYFKKQPFENQILNDGHEESCMEIITISKRNADVILKGRNVHLSE